MLTSIDGLIAGLPAGERDKLARVIRESTSHMIKKKQGFDQLVLAAEAEGRPIAEQDMPALRRFFYMGYDYALHRQEVEIDNAEAIN